MLWSGSGRGWAVGGVTGSAGSRLTGRFAWAAPGGACVGGALLGVFSGRHSGDDAAALVAADTAAVGAGDAAERAAVATPIVAADWLPALLRLLSPS